MSKNLNRPFFMDFLTTLSVRYSDKAYTEDFESEDEGEIVDNLHQIIHNSSLKGDNFMTMLLKPSYTTQESEKVLDPNADLKKVLSSASIKGKPQM